MSWTNLREDIAAEFNNLTGVAEYSDLTVHAYDPSARRRDMDLLDRLRDVVDTRDTWTTLELTAATRETSTRVLGRNMVLLGWSWTRKSRAPRVYRKRLPAPTYDPLQLTPRFVA